jgi:hypothetical protein
MKYGKRMRNWTALAGMAALMWLAPFGLWAQEQEEGNGEETAAEETAPAPAPEDPADEFAERLRRIQEQEKQQKQPRELTARGFSYDPGNRRDPFVSPHEVPAPEDPSSSLPPGIGRMRIQEIALMGVVHHPTWGKRAVVMGNDRKGYWLKEGDRLADGIIIYIDIENSEVVFRQDITDPLAIKPYREVKRQLHPVEEERRKK